MKLLTYTKPHVLIADEGKHIRDINDVYVPATETEEEHNPHYSTLIFVPNSFTENDVNKLYVEEVI